MKETRYKVWLEQAGFDLDAAKDSLGDSNYEWACYQAVQCVEKSLKSVIKQVGWHPPKTHRIGVLAGIANKANRNFERIKLNFRPLEAYTSIARYPFIIPGQDKSPHDLITKDDANAAITIAGDVYTKISNFLHNGGKVVAPTGELSLDNLYFTDAEVQARLNNLVTTLLSVNELGVKKIVLFGSFARESSWPRSSTMDILIVAETTLRFIERIQFVRDITKGFEPIIEPLIYTPEEFRYMLEEEGEGFLETAISEGKTLYDSEETVGT